MIGRKGEKHETRLEMPLDERHSAAGRTDLHLDREDCVRQAVAWFSRIKTLQESLVQGTCHTIAMQNLVSENKANIIPRMELSKARSSSEANSPPAIQSCCTNKHTLIGIRVPYLIQNKNKTTVFTMFNKVGEKKWIHATIQWDLSWPVWRASSKLCGNLFGSFFMSCCRETKTYSERRKEWKPNVLGGGNNQTSVSFTQPV